MDESYGKGSIMNIFGYKMNDIESSRASYVGMDNVKISEIFRESWKYPKGAYSVLTYTKTAIMLKTLENLLGRDIMDEIMQTYFIRWRFKHPAVTDFITIVNEIAPKRTNNKYGTNLNWYFEQTLYKAPDYAVTEIKGNNCKIERLGEMILPTEILIKFSDGKEKLINWNGKNKAKTYEFEKPIHSVIIDPNNKILLDLNLNNNSQTIEPSSLVFTKYALKFMFWLQNLMVWLG
jgi:aminopeptidase N